MRIAILTDVHGNAYALEAVLADLKTTSPDAVYNLGDTLWGDADPARAWALQQQHAPPTVRGNTDEMLTTLTDRAPEYRDWLLAQTGMGVLDTLNALPLVASLHNGELLLAHGQPDSAWKALMYTGGMDRAATPEELEARTEGWPARRVVVVGHTHTELLRHWRGVSYVNAGAVSRQKDRDPAARWLLLDRHSGGWNVQFRRVAYDTESAAKWAEAHASDRVNEARVLRTGQR